jgi:hypothetical protein
MVTKVMHSKLHQINVFAEETIINLLIFFISLCYINLTIIDLIININNLKIMNIYLNCILLFNYFDMSRLVI